MAGKRQHFIPQFIQRGFSSHYEGNDAFTWVYRKGSKPFNSNIKNVGVEGYFYSVDGDTELDQSITDIEGDFSELVLELRSHDSEQLDKSEELAKLLAHLEIRTRHLRQSFLEAGSYLMDELLKYVSDEEVFGRYLQKAIQRDPSLIENAIAKEMEKRRIPLEYLPSIIELSKPLIGQVLPNTMSMMSEFAVHFRNSLPQTMKEVVKTGHVRALVDTLSPESKVAQFMNLNFRVCTTDDVSLPLGDSIVVFDVMGRSSFKPFLERKDELLQVFLPLSSNQVLVGYKGNFNIEFEKLRREIACCSLEHFIASEPPFMHEDLIPLLSKNAYFLTNEQLKAMVDDLTNE